MSTIDPSKVQAGDTVTLERCGVTVTGTVESIGVHEGETPEFWLADSRAYDTDGYEPWTLTAHQPAPVPEWEPGTVYEITTPDGDTVRAWYLKHVPGGSAFVTRDGDEFTAEELASIQPVPDDAETLRAEVQRLEAEVERLRDRLEDAREANAELRGQIKKVREQRNDATADLGGLRASLDASTHFLISKGGTIWHHDQNCPHRREMPTREQIAKVLFRTTTGTASGANAGADAVLTLLEEGGAS